MKTLAERFFGIDEPASVQPPAMAPISDASALAVAAEALRQLNDRASGLEARDAGRVRARAAGYTEEAIGQLERFMRERGFGDYDAAMVAFERANPPPPQIATAAGWGPPPAPRPVADIRLLLNGDDSAFLDQAIPAALAETRGL